MENTHDFVEKLHDTQKKDEKNRQKQGDGRASHRLPNKQHKQGN